MLLSLALALATDAHAFCGTFVGAPGASLTNASSQVVLARQAGNTTLTLAVDYTGDASDFAIVLPVPDVLGPEDVKAGDAELITWIEAYGTPRAVAYTCDTLFDLQHTGMGCGSTLGCADQSVAGGFSRMGVSDYADDSVVVEREFTVGVYDIVVLSAEESSDLFTWLRNNGYELPRGGDDILQEYIDAGVYFLAARVSLDAPASGNVWLPPLQLRFPEEAPGLPIRIGTINADGPQEVLIHALTDVSYGGEMGIANYPEVKVDNECMWLGDDGADMATWYAAEVDAAVNEAGGAGWIKEYSADLVPVAGTGYHCDPCTAEPAIPGGTFAPLGFDGHAAHLTRIRMRYTAETAVSDLALYESGILGAASQLRYVTYQPELEFAFPVCNEGWVDNPGECPGSYVAGCTAPVPMSGLGVLVALLALRRRSA
jgi:hypothetical protein